MTDTAIPLIDLEHTFTPAELWDVSEAEPEAYRRLMIDRYTHCLFRPLWGFLLTGD